MKAKPVPLLTTFDMSSIFMLCAKLPKIPKIVIPAIKLVNVSNVVTINTSLKIPTNGGNQFEMSSKTSYLTIAMLPNL